MKKAGIVSFYSRENYGAILQAVALQNKINEFDIDSKYINYNPKLPLTGVKKILNILYKSVRYFIGYRKRLQKTNEFRNKYLFQTEKVDRKNLSKTISDFEIFIVGSDQVWNPKWIKPSDSFYLLKFIKNKPKFSYASSFGVTNLEDELTSIYKTELVEFKAISVREKTGEIILKNIGINSDIVLDPTLLLTKSEWLNFFDSKPIYKFKYILCYVMPGDNYANKYIEEYAKNMNNNSNEKYKIIFIGDKEYKRFRKGYNLICDAGPSEFLNLVYNASFVITNSFHGTCFSINFEKQFVSILKANNPLNNRITDLLTSLEVSDVIQYINTPIKPVSLDIVNYKDLNNRLNELRIKSLNYISNNILLR